MTDPRTLTSANREPPPPRRRPRAPSDPGGTDPAATAPAVEPTAPTTLPGPPVDDASSTGGGVEPVEAADGAEAVAGLVEVERAFVQILVVPELAVRIARASHHLKQTAYRARFQQTIVGALVERQFPDPNDPAVVNGAAALIARWRQEPLSDRRATRRLGWQLPVALSARLDQLLVNLKEQHYRLRPSATSLLAALIWFGLDPDSAEGQAALRQLAVAYYERWERPDYDALAA